MGQILFSGMKIIPVGACGGAAPPSVNLGPPHISGTITARMLKFYTHLDGPSALFTKKNFSHGAAPLV